MPGNFVAEAWSELAIALLFIILRLYTRVVTLGHKPGWDDYLMVAAGLAYTAETTAAYYVGAYWHGLANSGMTDEQRNTIDPKSEEFRLRVNGSKTHVIGWFTYTTLMWLLKTCWTIFYSRLTDGVQKMNTRIRIAYAFIAVTYVAAILVIVFKCYPLHKQWQIKPDPGNNCQPGFSKLQVSFIMAINTATDLYLMAIPLPMIYKAHLPLKRKISLLVLFSGGFIVIIFGILRCVTLLTLGSVDPAQSGEWSVRESFVAVLICNLPVVAPLFQRCYRKMRGLNTKGSSNNPSYPLSSNAQNSKRSKNVKHPLSVPNDTAWGSDEAIMLSETRDKSGASTVVTAGNKDAAHERVDDAAHTKGGARISVNSGNNNGRDGGHGSFRALNENGQIMVVTEYSVQAFPNQEEDRLQRFTPFTSTHTGSAV